eukprot:scaffold272_cov381-Prasinococcus_capsulatus_cf.AAC.8
MSSNSMSDTVTQGIAHRDVKPENVCLCERERGDSSRGANIKLVDFGFAQLRRNGNLFKTRLGSPNYVAPEVLLGKKYDEKIDVWSAGVLLFVMLSGSFPFHGATDIDMFRCVIRSDMDMREHEWAHVSQAGRDVVRLMLTKDPLKRPSCKQLLANPWIAIRGVAKSSPLPSASRDNFKKLNHSRKVLRRFQMAVEAVIAARRMQNLSPRCPTIMDVFMLESARRRRNRESRKGGFADPNALCADLLHSTISEDMSIASQIRSAELSSSFNSDMQAPSNLPKLNINTRVLGDGNARLLQQQNMSSEYPFPTTSQTSKMETDEDANICTTNGGKAQKGKELDQETSSVSSKVPPRKGNKIPQGWKGKATSSPRPVQAQKHAGIGSFSPGRWAMRLFGASPRARKTQEMR